MKTFIFIALVFSALWFTRPAAVIPGCLENNTVHACQYLDKE